MSFVFAPSEIPSVPVLGQPERFPVHRIYCVGRNYEEHAKEMGFTGREPPFFFLKPSDSLVVVNAGETGHMPYPSITQNLHHEIELVVAIGIGGKNIKAIQAESGAEISIEDDGTVFIYASRKESLERAVEMVSGQFQEIEVGKLYTGRVVSTTNFGAFMNLGGKKDGLIHISELADFRVNKTEDVVKTGDIVTAKCIGIDDKGRIKMSRKAAMKEKDAAAAGGEAAPAADVG